MRTWLNQFGSEYEIPQEILSLPDVVDTSWGNDAAPSFTLRRFEREGDLPLRTLWVEHPEPSYRECCEARFLVADQDGNELWSGEDVSEAINWLTQ